MLLDAVTYQRLLGEELRRLRNERGWTRKDLNNRLQSDISLQTLATYELGTRQCSVVRLVEICLAMGQQPQDLLARVHDRMFNHSTIGRIRIDLHRVVQDDQPELSPLRRWAEGRLATATRPDAADLSLDLPVVEWLAELCGLDTVDLIARLHRIGPPAPDRDLDEESCADPACDHPDCPDCPGLDPAVSGGDRPGSDRPEGDWPDSGRPDGGRPDGDQR